jgi:hypothetical protein
VQVRRRFVALSVNCAVGEEDVVFRTDRNEAECSSARHPGRVPSPTTRHPIGAGWSPDMSERYEISGASRRRSGLITLREPRELPAGRPAHERAADCLGQP